ncbi:hypothetical protein C7256_29170 [Enterocloster lavalensis]|nr:hypothetical protein C7256_29170 [Enterocloster lavalensis]
MLYYIYCVKMKMSERNFWSSPFKKVIKLIDMYQDESQMKISAINHEDYTSKYFDEEPQLIQSMREVEGFV